MSDYWVTSSTPYHKNEFRKRDSGYKSVISKSNRDDKSGLLESSAL